MPLADSCPCIFFAVHSYTPESAKDTLNNRKLPILLTLKKNYGSSHSLKIYLPIGNHCIKYFTLTYDFYPE